IRRANVWGTKRPQKCFGRKSSQTDIVLRKLKRQKSRFSMTSQVNLSVSSLRFDITLYIVISAIS
ncbi:hypothetical protein, partial [Brucella pseudogrignonensis]|uniref:hypothetical protein n=1 Tax=Brucella pseudogrignonensis TaxID=419475 RepID=UPI003BA28061